MKITIMRERAAWCHSKCINIFNNISVFISNNRSTQWLHGYLCRS